MAVPSIWLTCQHRLQIQSLSLWGLWKAAEGPYTSHVPQVWRTSKVSISSLICLDCNHTINWNIFYNNSAALQGGALNYDFLSPVGLRDNLFIMNTAAYGNNYASYPFKLALVMPNTSAKESKTNSTSSSSSSHQIISLSRKGIDNLVSGEKLTEKIMVGIYDQDDQLVEIHSGSEARLIGNEIIIDGNNK